ncbi:MAG: divergent PAP2 family protein [Oscillospiraceae bacterium]|jgi:acid phosphatase family membrane protein YuiD|nr:divergent PAP2 family protein [Oscillospiraceae bacterium]
MRGFFNAITGNHIINVSVAAFFIAQGLKMLVYVIQYRKFEWSRVFGSGGMPSSHAATVCALTVTVGRDSGMSTPQFAVAFVLAIIVMYDASNVRRSAGQHAQVLNYIMDNWHEKSSPKIFDKDLKELLGHTPFQVLCGAILGVALGFLL